jgi:hypothetical protein
MKECPTCGEEMGSKDECQDCHNCPACCECN